MRIYHPKNEIGENLLSAGSLINTSLEVHKDIEGGKVVLTNAVVPDVSKWTITAVNAVIAHELVPFQPHIVLGSDNITLVFSDNGRDLGFTAVRIYMTYNNGIGVFDSNIETPIPEDEIEDVWEDMIVDVSHQGTVEEIRQVASQIRASGIDKYKMAECKTVAECTALGFDKNTNAQFDYNVMSLENGNQMFQESKVQEFNSPLPLLKSASWLFDNSSIVEWNTDCPKLTYGYTMFYRCKSLKSVKGNFSSLTNGQFMFMESSKLTDLDVFIPNISEVGSFVDRCWSLKHITLGGLRNKGLLKKIILTLGGHGNNEVNIDYTISFDTKNVQDNRELANLANAKGWYVICNEEEKYSSLEIQLQQFFNETTSAPNFFYGNNDITDFSYDLPNLTNGTNMFQGCNKLKTAVSNMSSLENGNSMFFGDSALRVVNMNLQSLSNGYAFVISCTNLVSFEATLPSLSNGQYMFLDCRLDKPSVLRILNSIPTHTDGASHQLTIGCTKNARTVDGVTYEGCYKDGAVDPEITEALNNAKNKGWTVAITYHN